MYRIMAPLCIIGLLSAGILAGCGTTNRNFNTNQYDGRYNVYDYNDRTNINGTTNTDRTNIYGGSYPTNIYGTTTNGLTGTSIYGSNYPQTTFDNDDLRDRNFGTLNRLGTTFR